MATFFHNSEGAAKSRAEFLNQTGDRDACLALNRLRVKVHRRILTSQSGLFAEHFPRRGDLGTDLVNEVPMPVGYEEILDLFLGIFYDQAIPEDLGLAPMLRLFDVLELYQAYELSDRHTRSLGELLDGGNPGEGFAEWICNLIASIASINAAILVLFPGLAAARYDILCEVASMPIIDDPIGQMWQEQPVEYILHLPLDFLQAWKHFCPRGIGWRISSRRRSRTRSPKLYRNVSSYIALYGNVTGAVA
jgi:hypothetical protein